MCPTRAIKYYLARTDPIRSPEQKLLFVSYDSPQRCNKDIHPNTVSSWVRKLVLYCYEHAADEPAEKVKVRAHDLRGMANSLAIKGCAQMEHILQAGTWASPNTFLRFYYKDSMISTSGLHKIGPVVAAQHVVVP